MKYSFLVYRWVTGNVNIPENYSKTGSALKPHEAMVALTPYKATWAFNYKDHKSCVYCIRCGFCLLSIYKSVEHL